MNLNAISLLSFIVKAFKKWLKTLYFLLKKKFIVFLNIELFQIHVLKFCELSRYDFQKFFLKISHEYLSYSYVCFLIYHVLIL